TTQYLDEADQLADRLAIIDHGRIIAEGTPGQLKASVGPGGFRGRRHEAGVCSGAFRARAHDAAARPAAARMLAATLGVGVETNGDPVALTAHGAEPARITRALDDLAGAGVLVGEVSR